MTLTKFRLLCTDHDSGVIAPATFELIAPDRSLSSVVRQHQGESVVIKTVPPGKEKSAVNRKYFAGVLLARTDDGVFILKESATDSVEAVIAARQATTSQVVTAQKTFSLGERGASPLHDQSVFLIKAERQNVCEISRVQSQQGGNKA